MLSQHGTNTVYLGIFMWKFPMLIEKIRGRSVVRIPSVTTRSASVVNSGSLIGTPSLLLVIPHFSFYSAFITEYIGSRLGSSILWVDVLNL